ncbi:unnamed protein product [Orchesella dallaii]|uniref:Peptidase S1 domain-containing protein n=1 Tax=Orchesella dallaii TaxID=48710 RepID=A0ABP1RVA8_9HEXA
MEKTTTFYIFLIFLKLLVCQAENEISENTTEISQNQPKVVNGMPANQGEIPYQIGLYYIGGFRCGGSFIIVHGKHFIITAAHCVEHDLNPENYIVVAGEVNKYNIDSPAQERSVTKIIVHEGYVHTNSPDFTGNDIAILAIDSPFEINKFVSPIRLPRKKECVGSSGVVSGWGLLTESGPYSSVLQKANILVGPNKSCKRIYPDSFQPKTMICAGIRKGACVGDSGGPLKDSRKGFLAGIVSYGKTNCTGPKRNGVYTRVSAFVKWIEMQAQNI